MNPPNARVVAWRVIRKVLSEHVPLEAAFDAAAGLSAQDRALARELCSGTLRRYYSLREDIQRFLRQPFERLDADVQYLLLLGAYQIRHLRVPAYAAVSATVDVATHGTLRAARGLINAVLRRVADNDAPEPHSDAARHEHPPWLIEKLRDSYDAADALLAVNNSRAPMAVRVNRRRCTVEDFAARLRAAGIESRAGQFADHCLYLDQAIEADHVPGLAEGLCTIQDEGAQWAVEQLDLHPGQRVLDACAAPGNKTGHILESADSLSVVALDRDGVRLDTARANVRRLGLTAQFTLADAADLTAWWDGTPFDRILVDAPCSATGAIRRHPEIKLLRQPDDVRQLAHRQRSLLQALWPTLASGGMLVYCTCSLLSEENEQVIESFIDDHPDAALARYDDAAASNAGAANPGTTNAHALTRSSGLQLLPQRDGADGFFVARLRKANV